MSLPTRVPLAKAFLFAAVFFCVQQFEHTNFLFSVLYFAFLMLTVVAFNLAEGFTRLSGAYIFWYSMLIVIFGVTWKAVLGEPADSNLFSPVLDMSIYTASMFMLLLVTLLNRKFDLRSGGLGGGFSTAELNYTGAGLGCLIIWYAIMQADNFFGQAPGSLVSALAYFGYVALLSFSKQAMLTPMVCWIVGAVYARIKVRLAHVVAAVVLAVVAFGVVSPLSASRDLAEDLDGPQRLVLIEHLLTHYSVLQAHVKDLQLNAESNGVGEWYNTPQSSLVERLSMFPVDDELFDYSEEGHYEGMAPIYQYFGNLAPHFINPNKQVTYSGNFYAHEMGYGLGEDDYTTGISFSPVAEAFHCEGWGGVFWLLPVIWILLFSSTDFIVGDMTKYPWGLMVVVWYAHLVPEQLVGGMIYFLGYGNFGMLLAIVLVTRIAPIAGALFMGWMAGPPPRTLNQVRAVNLARPALPQAEG